MGLTQRQSLTSSELSAVVLNHTTKNQHSSSHEKMLSKWVWRDFLNITLGFWLIANSFSFSYSERVLELSDFFSGITIVVFGTLTLFPRFDLARWGICLTGIWLLFAPLIFWSKSAAVYNNDTFVGMLLIIFSVILPMMPSKNHHQIMLTPGPDTPPGWSYNPSDWIQRGPIIAMALLGFFLSRHLASFQLGHSLSLPDPFFQDGTERVLNSDISRAWPISDAGLGAISYLLEALSGCMGGKNRWRTMPWMVGMFSLLVIPLGVVSIVLVILQPIIVGAWCTLCLITAASMLIMIAPAVDEVIATCQFLLAAHREGKSFWKIFWLGGTLKSYSTSSNSLDSSPSNFNIKQILFALDLNNVPWNLIICAALGIWMLFVPTIFDYSKIMANNNYLVGALLITFSVIAFGEVTRFIRFLNIPFALWLMISSWIIVDTSSSAQWNNLIIGTLVLLLSIRRGQIQGHFAGWNYYLK